MSSRNGVPRDSRFYLILALIVIVLSNVVVVVWISFLSARSPQIELSEAMVLSASELCPGETLDYSFVISTNKLVSVDLTYSVRPQSPQVQASQLNLEQITFDGPSTLTLIRHWTVPAFYDDPSQGFVSWIPGAYVRRTAARVDGSSRIADSFEVDFQIREDCEL